jgi:hypothetical protein
MIKSSVFWGTVVTIIFFAVNGFINPVIAQTSIEENLRELAVMKLPAFLEKIPAGNERAYGFISRKEFSKIIIGAPYQVYTIQPDSIKDKILQTKQYLTPLDEWRIPITIDGKFRALATAAKVNGEWQLVDIGATSLAKELGEFESLSTSKKTSKRKSILRLYQLQCDFLLISDKTASIEMSDIHPMRSSKPILQSYAKPIKGYFTISELLPLIKEQLDQHTPQHEQ